MQKYTVSRVDGSTFQVIDLSAQREICVCVDYDDWEDAKQRAEKIATLLNERHQKVGRDFHVE